MNWKDRLTRPNRRRKVWSRSMQKWLSEEEEKIMHDLIAEKQKQIVDAIAKEPDVEEKKEEL